MNAFITSKSLPAIVQLDEEECGIRASLNRRHSHPIWNMRQELENCIFIDVKMENPS